VRNDKTVLAVGAHLKNAVALAVGDQVFLSQHIGDLETEQAHAAFHRVISEFKKLYATNPEVIAADLHPDYLSTKFILASRAPQIFQTQHHVAHVLSCMAENEIEPPALGVAWDGTGYGCDGMIWGGEFFIVTDESVERVAHLRPFRLPGGDAAVKEPRRAALGLLFEHLGDAVFQRDDLATVGAFADAELTALRAMLTRGLNAPWCSSVGRLFDVVASLISLRQRMCFEGQAATELEFALDGIRTDAAYEMAIGNRQSPIQLDWSPMIEAILADVQRGVRVGNVSAKFHNALAEATVAIAKSVGEERVALSGGCFQNRYLTERTLSRLREEHFRPYWHQRVPPNDGGIALGQIMAARRHLKQQDKACVWQFQEKLSASLARTR
jgi:hydrogenase maturation protein HypF